MSLPFSFSAQLKDLEAAGLLRTLKPYQPNRVSKLKGIIQGFPVTVFCSNDYLGLSDDPRLIQAAMEALEKYGVGATSSRLVAGNFNLHAELEEAVAAFKGSEAALVFTSGYQANVAVIQALVSRLDWVFCDRLNHASLNDGVRLSGGKLIRFRHQNLDHLETLLQKAPVKVQKWIVTESVFSMDGDITPLPELVILAEKYNAQIILDEAHATGLYGSRSSGLAEAFEVSDRILVQIGTFSKALGSSGAFVCGSRTLIQTLVNKARGLIYSTAMAPVLVAATIKAIHIVQTDPVPKNKLFNNVLLFSNCYFCNKKKESILSPIFPVYIGNSHHVMDASHLLLNEGFYVQGIRPPTVPENTARLRVTLSAGHTEEDIDAFCRVIKKIQSQG